MDGDGVPYAFDLCHPNTGMIPSADALRALPRSFRMTTAWRCPYATLRAKTRVYEYPLVFNYRPLYSPTVFHTANVSGTYVVPASIEGEQEFLFQHSHSPDIKLLLDRSRFLRLRAYMRIILCRGIRIPVLPLARNQARARSCAQAISSDVVDVKCNYNEPKVVWSPVRFLCNLHSSTPTRPISRSCLIVRLSTYF